MKKIVITGAAGFAGSHVYDHFRKVYPSAQIIIIDKFSYAADINNIPDVLQKNVRTDLKVGDICDLDFVLGCIDGADLVLHLAAESHVSASFDNSFVFTKNNTLGTHVILEACRIVGDVSLVHVSTDEVYGEKSSGYFLEGDALSPTNPYSASKAGAEMLVNSYIKSFNLPVKIIRANNLFGTRQHPEKVIPRFILKSLHKLPLTIHGDGSNKRHYLSTRDFSRAIETVVRKGSDGESYNVGSSLELTNAELSELIHKSVGSGGDNYRYFIDDRPFNDCRYAVDDSKLRSLGWEETTDLNSELCNLITWYRANSGRWDASLWEG